MRKLRFCSTRPRTCWKTSNNFFLNLLLRPKLKLLLDKATNP